MSQPGPTNPIAEDRSDRQLPVWWWVAVAIAVLTRMVVVADDEIIPQVYDATYYAQAAAHYFSSDAFSMFPTHRPGLSILAWSVAELGIPFKLFLDFLLVVVAICAGLAMRKLTGSAIAGLCIVLAFLFHPWFIVHSQIFMSEPLVSILLMVLLLTSIPLIRDPFREWPLGWAVVASLTASLFVLARNEWMLLPGFYVLVFLVVAIRQRNSLGRGFLTEAGGWRLTFLVLPVIAAWASMQAVKMYNQSEFGVRALCATEADGFTDLMSALYSIPTEEQIRFAPVTRQTLAEACRVSPVMAMFQNELLDVNRASYQQGKRKLGLDGEFGTWLNWHLIDCFRGLDQHSNQQMRVAAREIRAAQNRGELAKRFSVYPCDPLWKLWLPELPGEIYAALKTSFFEFNADFKNNLERRLVNNSVEKSFFDIGLLRRGGTGFNRSISVYARADAVENSSANSAQILSLDSQVIVEIPLTIGADGMLGFNVSLDDSENLKVRDPLLVRLVRKETETESFSSPVPLLETARGQVCHFEFKNGSDEVDRERWYVSSNRYSQDSRPRNLWNRRLARWPWAALAIASLAAFLCGVVTRPEKRLVRDMAWIAFVGLSFVVARSLFYCLINLWLAWGLGRYVEPNVFIGLFSFACLAFVLGAWCSRFAPRRNNTPVE